MEILILNRVDIVDAVQRCGSFFGLALLLFQRSQFFEDSRILAAHLFVVRQHIDRGLLIPPGEVC